MDPDPVKYLDISLILSTYLNILLGQHHDFHCSLIPPKIKTNFKLAITKNILTFKSLA